MIINNAPQHEAVMSNVGEIGEFRIRNSAKAFNILSSGLYANKIKAIIRELSCNAVDSHTAAGKQDTPFDVHLPNQLDPAFRIRDYGTGLTHDQVINIYTTYFESTKTESNAFIGALGLGSKSPFSYTDNFTVTAIKDGRRNVYSAFINGEGVPSIALMHGEDTTDPNGVEIQFAVTDRWDFDKFRSEARDVYTHFSLRPVVSGGEGEFTFRDVEYKDKNIIPGVHYLGRGSSRAVMGNISYPIDMPNAESNLGDLRRLLGCGLEMHFDIGELDFQASREGLSYIPSTIDAIKNRLIALNAQLAVHLEMEADTITNAWEKIYFLQRKAHEDLWSTATRAYLVAKPPVMIDATNAHYIRAVEQTMDVKKLASKYNISILAFSKNSHTVTCSEVRPSKRYLKNDYSGPFEEYWSFSVDPGTIFVTNDTKKGALTRAKYHWRHCKSKGISLPSGGTHHVYVMSPAVKNKAMNVKAFMSALNQPPEAQCVLASSLIEKERKDSSVARAKDVRILRLQMSDHYRRSNDVTWQEAGRADEYDAKQTYYYIPLSGYSPVNIRLNPHSLYNQLRGCGITALNELSIYGVRKGDIEWVRTQSNWVELEGHIAKVLTGLTATALGSLAISEVDSSKTFGYNKDIVALVKPESPYRKYVDRFKGVERSRNFHPSHLVKLCEVYAPAVDYKATKDQLKAETAAVRNRYPLLNSVQDYNINEFAIAEYITLIDNSKGI